MLESKRYSLDELREALRESTNEFKPRKGDGVDAENKKNNGEAVRDIEKRTKEYDGGFQNKERKTPPEDPKDFNKTTLEYNFVTEPSKEYKDRVKQLAVYGTPHELSEEEKDPEKNGGYDYSSTEKFYDDRKEVADIRNERQTDERHAGLKARMYPRETFENDTLFKESRTMKRLNFKNTKFLSEAQMLEKVPDSYKFDGNKFVMRDSTGTDYLVECKVDEQFGYTDMKVIGQYNKEQIKEQLSRMRNLYGYSSGEFNPGTTNESREKETEALTEMLHRVKSVEEEK